MTKLSILVLLVAGVSAGAFAADDNTPVTSNDHRAGETGPIDNGVNATHSKVTSQKTTSTNQQEPPVSSNDHRATETGMIDQNASNSNAQKPAASARPTTKDGDKTPIQEGFSKQEENRASQSTQKAPALDSEPTSSSVTPQGSR